MRFGEYGHPSVAGAFQTRGYIHKGKPLTIMQVYPLRSHRECNYCTGIPAMDPKELRPGYKATYVIVVHIFLLHGIITSAGI